MSPFQKNKGFEGHLHGVRIFKSCSHFYVHGEKYSQDHPTQDIVLFHFYMCNILSEHVYFVIFILFVIKA